jgi:siroheme synthase
VFGRGSEEALVLREAGIDVVIAAGVSALRSVPGAAGVPITHRGISAQVTVVSGHSASDAHLDYDQLATTPGTLVVFMGLAHLGELTAGLIAAGRDPSTAAAVISQGTTPTQQSVRGALAEIAELAAELASPALLVVGDVVDLAVELAAPRAARAAGAVLRLVSR